MPLVKHSWEGETPQGPHLALLADADGGFIAINPGAQIYLVEDANRADKIFPMILAKVSRRTLTFVCGCADPRCDRKYKFDCKVSGWHHRKQRNTAHEVEPSAQPAPSPKTDDPTSPS